MIQELKLSEAQLEKQSPLLNEMKNLKEAAKLSETGFVLEPQVIGLIERC